MSTSAADSTKGTRIEPELQREILSAFQGNIQPVSLSASYRLGILLVAFVMVLLPLIYIGIIALVGMAVYYHAVNHTEVLNMASGRGKLFAVLLYAAPMVIGGILILFMFKPLFSRPAKRAKREPLSSDEEPLLFAFVERICEAVRAPSPRRIEIDEEVNASASFRRGFWSMLGNDLVLTIGLPLVAGLDLRQFGGVLAHEFGHFSQGAGMRLTYIIRTISHWFTRVVYERDEWDERLVNWSQESDLRFGWILYLARMFVWITRKILWVLMMTGHCVSGFMLRQMEFDADRHEARLAGSDAFESTMRRIVLLSVASQGANSDLGDFYREGRLCDNLPKLILHNLSQFTPEVRRQIIGSSEESSTGWLDTHPSQTDRIASARKENSEGVFQLEMPASVLFSNYDEQCRHVTWEFYRQIFGDQLTPEEIHPVDELLKRQEQEQRAFHGLHRFLQATFRGDRPLRLPSWRMDPPADIQATVEKVKAARAQMIQAVPQYEQDYSRLEGIGVADRKKLAAELVVFETLAGARIEGALCLLHAPDIARHVEHAPQCRQEAEMLLPVLQRLNKQLDSVMELGYGNQQLAGLFQQLSQDNSNQSAIASLQHQMRRSGQLINDVRQEFNTLDYPFDHAKGKISLGEFALAELPDVENPGQIYEAAGGLVESTSRLRARLTGHLCLIAEQVEAALGLEPLDEPAREDAAETPTENPQ